MAAVLFYPRHGSHTTAPLNSVAAESNQQFSPLDQVASANIALTAANMTGIEEATAIGNQADSERIELAMATASSSVVAKPQVITTGFKSNKDIIVHTVVAGDTVSSLASKYGVTSDSIRWSNNLTGEKLQVGKVLYLPPEGVDGIVYTVKAGDTPDSLARKFSSNRDKIIAFNFAEVSGLKVGERILIPNGLIKPARVSYNSYSFGPVSYAGNAYWGGQCTWYVYNRRAAAGNPVPSNMGDAYTWDDYFQLHGMPWGRTPKAGAVAVTRQTRQGHVAYVERVNSDGSIVISEMNYNWVPYSLRTITVSAATASGYTYLY
jgi:surface antigen